MAEKRVANFKIQRMGREQFRSLRSLHQRSFIWFVGDNRNDDRRVHDKIHCGVQFGQKQKKGRSQWKRPFSSNPTLIFVIVARDLFEQIVGVVVGQVGVVQVVSAWLRVVVQHAST